MGCGIAIIKHIVFIFNLVFALIGLALLSIGVLYKLDLDAVSDAISLEALDTDLPPILLIVVGATIFVIAFFGCCGAIRESPCCLITYGVLLLSILLIQIAIGIYAFLKIKDAGNIDTGVRGEVQNLFGNYTTNERARNDMNQLQQVLKCCGVDGPLDWPSDIPKSCCIGDKNPCQRTDPSLYSVGCVEKYSQKVKLIVRTMGYVVLGIGATEVIGIICAFCLTSSIRNNYRRGNYA